MIPSMKNHIYSRVYVYILKYINQFGKRNPTLKQAKSAQARVIF